jgi:hypothetical protein
MATGIAVLLGWATTLHTFANDPAKSKPDAKAADEVIAELKRIGELIKQLDDDKFEKRQQATEQLLKIGKPAIEPLKLLLASNPNLELAKRASNILENMPKEKIKGIKTKELIARLAKPISFENGIPANTPLRDALDYISEQARVPFIVDTKAFERIGVQKVEEQPVQMEIMTDVRLADVLRLLLCQVKGDVYVGDYLLRRDYVEITTSYDSFSEVLGGDIGAFAADEGSPSNEALLKGKPRVLRIVHIDVERRPLKEAIQELAESASVGLVVDPRIGDKGKTPVTATLNNVFFDTAVQLLCDMADLQVFQMDAVFYLTTKENATKLEAQQKPRRIVPPPGLAGPPSADK